MPAYPDDPPQRQIRVGAQFVDDPMRALAPEESLQFEAALIGIAGSVGRSAWLSGWPVFRGMLLSVNFASADEGYDAIGSAVLVAPGLALCAHHVVKPYYDRMLAGKASCVCVGPLHDRVNLWRLNRATWVGGTDLELLNLSCASELPTDRAFSQAVLTTRTPRIGETLKLCGFRRDRMDVKPGEIACHGNVLVCQGRVQQVYPQSRDRAMLSWPVVEVDCPAWGAMSGGPVFDERGYLIGLVCSSVEGCDGPAYVSLLWPALGHPVPTKWPFERDGLTSLHQLDACLIEGREAFSAIPRDAGSVAWTVQHW
ncbi:trypsin-like peptidase domain-containing protein [Aquincola sp. S2]|uniref:Trypsin-like peptidase domain-containing protein n=1 Tax=Pseudaquabacterium terrae TaxID=2732868 RepID=A0ABX2EF86_9BURK|nr:serine protease [Aquabacterium terrae]NRF67268.1 trypsin-like peptidase domain-containing protein [Aquabacterium terrae]